MLLTRPLLLLLLRSLWLPLWLLLLHHLWVVPVCAGCAVCLRLECPCTLVGMMLLLLLLCVTCSTNPSSTCRACMLPANPHVWQCCDKASSACRVVFYITATPIIITTISKVGPRVGACWFVWLLLLRLSLQELLSLQHLLHALAALELILRPSQLIQLLHSDTDVLARVADRKDGSEGLLGAADDTRELFGLFVQLPLEGIAEGTLQGNKRLGHFLDVVCVCVQLLHQGVALEGGHESGSTAAQQIFKVRVRRRSFKPTDLAKGSKRMHFECCCKG